MLFFLKHPGAILLALEALWLKLTDGAQPPKWWTESLNKREDQTPRTNARMRVAGFICFTAICVLTSFIFLHEWLTLAELLSFPVEENEGFSVAIASFSTTIVIGIIFLAVRHFLRIWPERHHKLFVLGKYEGDLLVWHSVMVTCEPKDAVVPNEKLKEKGYEIICSAHLYGFFGPRNIALRLKYGGQWMIPWRLIVRNHGYAIVDKHGTKVKLNLDVHGEDPKGLIHFMSFSDDTLPLGVAMLLLSRLHPEVLGSVADLRRELMELLQFMNWNGGGLVRDLMYYFQGEKTNARDHAIAKFLEERWDRLLLGPFSPPGRGGREPVWQHRLPPLRQ